MTKVSQLVICGASMTFNSWFSWRDVADDVIDSDDTIDLGLAGVSNRWMIRSLLALIPKLRPDSLIMPMFTSLDKWDLYLDHNDLPNYVREKSSPIDLDGEPAGSDYGYWCTGSWWPNDKHAFRAKYWKPDDAASTLIMEMLSLKAAAEQRSIKIFPLFDSHIWNNYEQDYLSHATRDWPLPSRDFLSGPVTGRVKHVLDDQWLDSGQGLLAWAIERKQPIWNPVRQLHPSSATHRDWFLETVLPKLARTYQTRSIDPALHTMIESMSKEW